MFVTSLFPRLKVAVDTFPRKHKQRIMTFGEYVRHAVYKEVDIKIYKPISTSCIFGQVMRTPMRQATSENEDVPDHQARGSNRSRTACDSNLLPSPLPVRNLVLDTAAYLYDDGKMDLQPIPLAAHPSRRSPFNWKMYNDYFRLKHQSLRSPYAPSINPGNDFRATHIVDSLFETLKVAAWCAVALGDRPDAWEGSSI